MSGSCLDGASLFRADLSKARLSEASLTGTILILADVAAADFSKAGLIGANLLLANLSRTSLRGGNLLGASLSSTNLHGTDFSGAIFSGTSFGRCDLSECVGLELANHESPSSIGIDTLIASFRGAGNKMTPEMGTFFRAAGVPNELLEVLPKMVSEIKYHSCFVSYGEPDREFAERLAGNLKASGVSCWLYSMDATPGKRTWQEIRQKRREAERMIVLCSGNSMVRDGVRKEVEEQIDEDSEKLVPVSLDNLWKHDGFEIRRGSQDLKPFLLNRNYADFSHLEAYDKSLEKLLVGLERADDQ